MRQMSPNRRRISAERRSCEATNMKIDNNGSWQQQQVLLQRQGLMRSSRNEQLLQQEQRAQILAGTRNGRIYDSDNIKNKNSTIFEGQWAMGLSSGGDPGRSA